MDDMLNPQRSINFDTLFKMKESEIVQPPEPSLVKLEDIVIYRIMEARQCGTKIVGVATVQLNITSYEGGEVDVSALDIKLSNSVF